MRRLFSYFVPCLVLLLLPLGLLASSAPASAQTATTDDNGCYIPKDHPVAVHVQAGEVTTIRCNNGQISVSREALSGTPPGPSTRSAVAAPEGQKGAAGASAQAAGSAQCNTESVVYDQSYSNIVLTLFRLSAYWSWDYTQIDSIWGGYAGYDYDSDTGWEVDYSDAYWYEPDYDNNGNWVDNGFEGWAGFSWEGVRWSHEHHIIMWMDADGGCWGNDYFWGSIPGWSYEQFYSWTA